MSFFLKWLDDWSDFPPSEIGTLQHSSSTLMCAESLWDVLMDVCYFWTITGDNQTPENRISKTLTSKVWCRSWYWIQRWKENHCNFLKNWNTFLFLRMTHKNNIHLTLSRWRSTTRAGGGGSSTASSGPTANLSDFFFPFDEPIKIKQSHTMKKKKTRAHITPETDNTWWRTGTSAHIHEETSPQGVSVGVFNSRREKRSQTDGVLKSKNRDFFSKLWLTAQLTINTRNY